MHNYEIKPWFKKKLIKIFKKDKYLYEKIIKKINEIINSDNVSHYKNLRYNMKDSKRIHIGPFVLVFNYDKLEDFISFEDFDHHDNIYLRK